MGRREMSGRLSAEYQGLEVKVPSLFRCPISLDVMRSPVSLCTGVTYERTSIQRWLDSGNTTCPATMLPLPSTDLVPNLTLRRLIALWASTAAPASPSSSSPPAAGCEGGLARLLLLMQSGCSAAARQMASELLKIFKVSGKSCLAGYDSKNSHIMPF